jgi:hypothetical protein
VRQTEDPAVSPARIAMPLRLNPILNLLKTTQSPHYRHLYPHSVQREPLRTVLRPAFLYCFLPLSVLADVPEESMHPGPVPDRHVFSSPIFSPFSFCSLLIMSLIFCSCFYCFAVFYFVFTIFFFTIFFDFLKTILFENYTFVFLLHVLFTSTFFFYPAADHFHIIIY